MTDGERPAFITAEREGKGRVGAPPRRQVNIDGFTARPGLAGGKDQRVGFPMERTGPGRVDRQALRDGVGLHRTGERQAQGGPSRDGGIVRGRRASTRRGVPQNVATTNSRRIARMGRSTKNRRRFFMDRIINPSEVVEWFEMKRWQFWLGVGISVVFLYISLRGLHLQDLKAALEAANYWWLIPGITIYFLAVWARAWRWHYLLRPIKSIPTRKMFPIVCIGYMGNNIYPARAGEVLRAVVLKHDEGVAISASLATIIVERVFDGVVMLSFIFLNLSELTRLTSHSGLVGSIQAVALIGTFVFIGALAIFLVAAMFPERAMVIATKFARRFLPVRFQEKVLDIANKFLSGLGALRSPRDALMVFVTSVVLWLLETGKYWFLMHAFPFQVSFFALMLMNGIVNLATTIPSAPGYVGTFDAPGIAVLTAYNVPLAIATAYTLVLHARYGCLSLSWALFIS